MKKNGLCEKERDPWNLVTDLVGSTEPTLWTTDMYDLIGELPSGLKTELLKEIT